LGLAGVFGAGIYRQVVRIEGESDGRGDEARDTVYGYQKEDGRKYAALRGPAMGEEGG
jgi:hypothetical protein